MDNEGKTLYDIESLLSTDFVGGFSDVEYKNMLKSFKTHYRNLHCEVSSLRQMNNEMEFKYIQLKSSIKNDKNSLEFKIGALSEELAHMKKHKLSLWERLTGKIKYKKYIEWREDE